MSEALPQERDGRTLDELIRAMMGTLRGYWTEAAGYQKFLYLIGATLLASAAFHFGVLLLTGGSWKGPVSWRKPILFGESFGLTAISIAWVMTFLPKRAVIGWLLAVPLGVSNLGEVVWVSMQQWRGVPAHFNFSTPFDAAAFNIGGGGFIAVTGIVILVVTLLSFFSLRAPPSFAWAIRIGLVMLIAAMIFGQRIIQNGISKVVDPHSGEFVREGIRSASIFGAAGAMKIPHALSLHALQVLPVLAFLLLFTRWSESRRTKAVVLAAMGYIGLVAVSAFQTFNGLAPFDLSLLVALALALSAAGLAGTYGAALLGLRQTLAGAGSEYVPR